jgi:branched-chain amino acid transport system substrate-binding protein
MTSQLGKLKAADVDTLIIWGQTTAMSQVFRSMEKLNYYPLALTSWVAEQRTFAQSVGDALADKALLMRTLPGGDLSPEIQRLYERIKSKTTLGDPTMGQAAHCYDAVMLLAAAIRQANSTDGDAIRTALESLKTPYKGLMKTYSTPWSATEREALREPDYHWIKWKGGRTEAYSDDIIASLKLEDFKH